MAFFRPVRGFEGRLTERPGTRDKILAAALGPVVVRGVDEDLEEPGSEALLGVEGRKILEGSEKSVLDDFLRVLGVAGEAVGKPQEPVPVGIDQRAEGGRVAAQDAFHEVSLSFIHVM
jgi:hypothetical protein